MNISSRASEQHAVTATECLTAPAQSTPEAGPAFGTAKSLGSPAPD